MFKYVKQLYITYSYAINTVLQYNNFIWDEFHYIKEYYNPLLSNIHKLHIVVKSLKKDEVSQTS